ELEGPDHALRPATRGPPGGLDVEELIGPVRRSRRGQTDRVHILEIVVDLRGIEVIVRGLFHGLGWVIVPGPDHGLIRGWLTSGIRLLTTRHGEYQRDDGDQREWYREELCLRRQLVARVPGPPRRPREIEQPARSFHGENLGLPQMRGVDTVDRHEPVD